MFALVFNKKVVIFAQGFTPFRTRLGKFLVQFVLKRCHKITVRDEVSQKFLKDLGIKAELLSDPVFSIDVGENIQHKGIGVQLRSFAGLEDYFLQNLATKIAERFSEQEIKLFSLQDNLDLGVIEKFSEMLVQKGLRTKIYKSFDINQTIFELSQLEYLIGMRFHSNLVAAKAGVKVLGINYDIKVKTLSEMIKFPLLELRENISDELFEELLKLDVGEYNIPKFEFPKFG